MMPERFVVGEPVVWRSRPGRGPVGYVVGANVVMDGPDGVALFRTSPYSVVRQWNGSGFDGWYVNLEDPWERVSVGFDSQDLTLDVVFADDRSSWDWKDEDELVWEVEAGIRTVDEATYIRHAGELAIEHEQQGSGVFGFDWNRLHPDLTWPMPALPDGWAA